MSFHRLTVPIYEGGLPAVDYDYINNEVSGTPAGAGGAKSGGPNVGTYYVAFGEDATSENSNRAHEALAENTDFLDDLMRADLAGPVVSVPQTAGGVVSSIDMSVVAGASTRIFVGGATEVESQRTRSGLFMILDEEGLPLHYETSTGVWEAVKVVRIQDGGGGGGNNVFGSGFHEDPVIDVLPTIPTSQVYRVVYYPATNLATQAEGIHTRLNSGHYGEGDLWSYAKMTRYIASDCTIDSCNGGEYAPSNMLTWNERLSIDDSTNPRTASVPSADFYDNDGTGLFDPDGDYPMAGRFIGAERDNANTYALGAYGFDSNGFGLFAIGAPATASDAAGVGAQFYGGQNQSTTRSGDEAAHFYGSNSGSLSGNAGRGINVYGGHGVGTSSGDGGRAGHFVGGDSLMGSPGMGGLFQGGTVTGGSSDPGGTGIYAVGGNPLGIGVHGKGGSLVGVGVKGEGTGSGPGIWAVGDGGLTTLPPFPVPPGLYAVGGSDAMGIVSYGTGEGVGVWALGGTGDDGHGVLGEPQGDGHGVWGAGGGSGADISSVTENTGVVGTGGSNAPGMWGIGGGNGAGVFGAGGPTNGLGVHGLGEGTGSGVYGEGGDSGGYGVEGLGVGTGGIGVKGTGHTTAVADDTGDIGGYFAGGGGVGSGTTAVGGTGAVGVGGIGANFGGDGLVGIGSTTGDTLYGVGVIGKQSDSPGASVAMWLHVYGAGMWGRGYNNGTTGYGAGVVGEGHVDGPGVRGVGDPAITGADDGGHGVQGIGSAADSGDAGYGGHFTGGTSVSGARGYGVFGEGAQGVRGEAASGSEGLGVVGVGDGDGTGIYGACSDSGLVVPPDGCGMFGVGGSAPLASAAVTPAHTGVYGFGGVDGLGVVGQGGDTAAGVYGLGGPSGGKGGYFTAGGGNGDGLFALGTGRGVGIYAQGGASGDSVGGGDDSRGVGVVGHGGTGGGDGVQGFGKTLAAAAVSAGGYFEGEENGCIGKGANGYPGIIAETVGVGTAPLRLIGQASEPGGLGGCIYYNYTTKKLYFHNDTDYLEIATV